MLSEPHVNFNPGERVLITGESGEEKALLFRAVSGLWPWGSGRITHPPRQSIVFMPVRAYIPPGTLRAAVAYPHSTHVYDATAVAEALAYVGLEHLELDMEDRWDRRLTDDEKQRVAFARVALQRPRWVVAHDAFETLEPESRARIRALFMGEAAHVGFINIGNDQTESNFYVRKLRLMVEPRGLAIELAGRDDA